MSKYNFDEIVDRENTNCFKYDAREMIFGTSEVLPMWVADMDFKAPDFITEAINSRASHPLYGYTLKTDLLYNSFISWVQKRHGWEIKKEWMSFSPGIVPALHYATLAFTNPGDKIILQPPVYHPFFYAIEHQGREVLNNPLILKNGRYYMDFDQLEKSMDSSTKMIFLCNPQNPCSRVWEPEELIKLAEICLKHNIVMISDEIHSDLIYTGFKHTPLASISKEIADNVITLMAPTKTFNLAGLCTSVLIASNESLKKKINTFLDITHVNSGNIFGLTTMEASYSKGEMWVGELLEYLEENIKLIKDFLEKKIPVIKLINVEATYLAWLDCRELGLSGKELSKFMIKAGLGLNDGTLFGKGGEGFQRLNFGCQRSVLKEALEKLENSVKKDLKIKII